VQDAKLQILKEQRESNNPDKYRLSIDTQNIIGWFREQYQRVKQSVRPHIKPIPPQPKKGRGI
jgi:hypothetical protein